MYCSKCKYFLFDTPGTGECLNKKTLIVNGKNKKFKYIPWKDNENNNCKGFKESKLPLYVRSKEFRCVCLSLLFILIVSVVI